MEPELLPFIGANGQEAVCRVEIIPLRDGRRAVICEELSDNPGNSVSDSWESVVAKVCTKYELNPRAVVWIEHIRGEIRRPDGLSGRWHLVTFKRPKPGRQQGQAEWRKMTRDDWHELGLDPRD